MPPPSGIPAPRFRSRRSRIMKSVEKSKAKSFGTVAPVAAPVPTATKGVSSGVVAPPLNADDLAVLELGELTEFSRDCWIAAIQDLAGESRLRPAPKNVPVSPAA